MPHKNIWIGTILLIVVTVLITGFVLAVHQPAFYGAEIQPSKPVSDISAVDMHGDSFHLSAMHGKVVLLYFGYVHCPLECPLTMAHLKQVLGILGTDARNVQVVMISTDPQRDTPQAMNEFLGNFDPSYIGITGDPVELSTIYRNYGVVALEGGETHSSFTYVIDQKGKLRLTYVPDSEPEDIAHDLRIILSEN
jgi:protein SCO1